MGATTQARRATLAAEQDRITGENDRRAARKAAERHDAEQRWIDAENDRRAALTAAERQAAIDKPIYPRELAEKIASDYVKVAFPDWRLLRHESRQLFGQLVKQQPEMAQREIKQRYQILTMVRSNLPGHIVPLVTDLQTIYDLLTTAQESAAFMVGFALGRKAERVHFDTSKGIVRTRRAGAQRNQDTGSGILKRPAGAQRLHDGTEVP